MKRLNFSFSVILLPVLILIITACYKPAREYDGSTGNTAESRESNFENTENSPAANIDNSAGNADASNRNIEANVMKEEGNEDLIQIAEGDFRENLNRNLSRSNLTFGDVMNEANPVERRILSEYGAVFLTRAMPPAKVMFTSENGVSEFQNKAGIGAGRIGGTNIELQPEALKALEDAISEAKQQGLKITPRDGAEAARRSFDKTLKLWNSRFEPALKHWKSKGRLTDEQISDLRKLTVKDQVEEVLELEKEGIYFNTFFNNSILYSVAAPGTSQHLSMLAFDAGEFGDKKVRRIMANHGWFRTVQNDEPHFTYLGYKESDLPRLGLKKVIKKSGEFWIPKM